MNHMFLLCKFFHKNFDFISKTIKVNITEHLESLVQVLHQTASHHKLKIIRNHHEDLIHSRLEAVN